MFQMKFNIKWIEYIKTELKANVIMKPSMVDQLDDAAHAITSLCAAWRQSTKCHSIFIHY